MEAASASQAPDFDTQSSPLVGTGKSLGLGGEDNFAATAGSQAASAAAEDEPEPFESAEGCEPQHMNIPRIIVRGPRAVAEYVPSKEEALGLIREIEEVGEPEPIAKAVHAMKCHIADPIVQWKGCYALALQCVEHSRVVMRSGGLEAVMSAMGRHGTTERVQIEGCEFIYRLSSHHDGAARIMAQGGLQCVINAIDLFQEKVRVQEEACAALCHLAAYDAASVIGARGLELVVTIMEKMVKQSWVQMWGCGALKHCALHDAAAVERARGFEAAARAVKTHPDNVEVQRIGKEVGLLSPTWLASREV